jgi:16S rRNA pseudouridine516 synthase
LVKLLRLLVKRGSLSGRAARLALTEGRIRVDGAQVVDAGLEVDRFARVEIEGEAIQEGAQVLQLMLNKPPGVLSACSDPVHQTVIDLIDHPARATLHPAGRLDRASSGLILLTNDGRWSKRITAAAGRVPKVYLVGTRDPIHEDDVAKFAQGFHFHTEDITTLPAGLVILGERLARLTLVEGRYHQIKRMFHRVGNRVTTLHRESVGPLHLPDSLAAGEWRFLDPEEAAWF